MIVPDCEQRYDKQITRLSFALCSYSYSKFKKRSKDITHYKTIRTLKMHTKKAID